MHTSMIDTQIKVSQKSHTSQATVQRLLSREQSSTVDVVEKIAHAFGIKNAAYMLLEDDEMKLLSVWNTLSETDKLNILGFINVQKSIKGDTKEADQFNMVSIASLGTAKQGLAEGTFSTDETRPAESKKNSRRKA
ncbi:hypothetical protein B9Z51_08785 [Limnohabitans sp. T6-5]|nr:hypothetical protein B9Z51_08785 [Limnohabitans sp. T6-5]